MDKVIEHIPGERAVAVKNVTINEPQFQGHFPERPLMPGVLIVESMAQVGGIIVTQMPDLPRDFSSSLESIMLNSENQLCLEIN